jgi:hypothetical protein
MSNKMSFTPFMFSNTNLKVETVTGQTGGTMGSRIVIPRQDYGDIDDTRILTVPCIVNAFGHLIPPEFSAVAGFKYSVWINPDGLNLELNSGDSSQLLNKPFTILIVYIAGNIS